MTPQSHDLPDTVPFDYGDNTASSSRKTGAPLVRNMDQHAVDSDGNTLRRDCSIAASDNEMRNPDLSVFILKIKIVSEGDQSMK